MKDLTLLGPWVHRFLLEHLVAERNLARNTQRSYRDALILLLPFAAEQLHQPVDRLNVMQISADLVRLFLTNLEQSRKCFDCNPEPAPRRDSCAGPVCGRAQSGAHRLVWSDSLYPFQKDK